MFEFIGRYFISNDIAFDPPFPEKYIIGLWVILVAMSVITYRRTRGNAGRMKRLILTLFRVAAITGITVVLLRPVVEEHKRSEDSRSSFKIFVDVSESMATCDVDESKDKKEITRLDVALDGLRTQISDNRLDISRDFDYQYYKFADSIKETSVDELMVSTPNGTNTDIAAALIGASSISPNKKTSGVLLVSDGRDNSSGEVTSAAMFLKSQNIPVWTTTVGTTQEGKDLYLSARLNQNFLFKGQKAKLKVDISQSGYKEWYAQVELFRNEEMVGVPQQVMLNSSNTRLEFPIEEEVKGTYQYTAKVQPLIGESDLTNNERTVFVKVVDEKSQVLFLEAEPYWDSKFLLRTLQVDPNFEVTAVFLMSDKKRKTFAITQRSALKSNSRFSEPPVVRVPRTRKDLFKYDCIILGKGAESFFTSDEMKLFKAYLEERGGSIIFARGKSYEEKNSILGQIDPVIWGDGKITRPRFQITSAGRTNPIFDFGKALSAGLVIRELPELISVSRVEATKATSVILAKAKSTNATEEIAAISYKRHGKGKVLSIGSTGLWKWAFTPAKLQKYDEVYAKFWGQMMRWLIYGSDFLPGQDVSFRTEKLTYNLGETVPLIVQTKDTEEGTYHPRVDLKTPDGRTTIIRPEPEEDQVGFLTSTYLPELEGTYSAELYSESDETNKSQGSIRFTVYSDAVEKRFVAANHELMDQIATITGGAKLEINQWNELPKMIKDFELFGREEQKPDDAWDRLDIFFWLICLLGVEWFIRRKTGLV